MLPSNYAEEFFKLPEPDAQMCWDLEFKKMVLHTQEFEAEKLIDTRRPNEPLDVNKYRKDNFEHITGYVIIRAINNLQRYFSQSKATVKTDADTTAYLSDVISFDTYLNQRVINRMIEDANGLLVWWVDDEGVTDPTIKVQPRPMLVLSQDVRHFTEDYVSFKTRNKSFVTNSKGDEIKEGEIYFIVDKTGYYTYTQVGRRSDKKFILKTHYEQEFKEVPVIVLGGESRTKIDEQGEELNYLTSFFAGFVPFANEAIRQFSDHQAIMITTGFPVREVEGIACEVCNEKGVVDNGEETIRCKECNGTGVRVPTSPYGVYIKRPSSNTLDGGGDGSRDSVRFVSPDVAILQESGRHWKDMLFYAESALNINYTLDSAQSGKAKELDRENLTAMLDRIGMNLYMNIYRKTVMIVQALLSRGEKTEVSIMLPNSFKIRSEKELVDELNSLIEKDSSILLIVEVNKELIRKRYAGNANIIHLVDLLSLYDPFFGYPNSKLQDMNATGQIDVTEFRRSLFSYNTAIKIMTDKGEEFVEMTFEQFEKQMDVLIAPKLIQNAPTI